MAARPGRSRIRWVTALALTLLMVLTAVGPSAAAPVNFAPYDDGEFVQAAGDPRVFIVVGGSPVYVDSFAPYGGPPARIMPVTDNYLDHWPAPVDGTLIATLGEGKVYQFIGGAPVYVDSWQAIGGARPFTWVSTTTVAQAGRGPWSKLRSTPRDGAMVVTAGDGRVYRFVGGAPIYLDSFRGIRDWPSAIVPVSAGTVARAGTSPWANLRQIPADGTVAYVESGGWVVFVGGSILSSPAGSGTILSAGFWEGAGAGPWSQFGRRPTDGSLIASAQDGKVYQVIGGAPVYVDSWAAVGGPRPFVWVHQEAIRPTYADRWQLDPMPADGTFIATTGEGRVLQFIGGAPVYVDSWASVGGVKPFTWTSPRAVSAAGTGNWSNYLRSPNGSFVATTGEGKVYQFIGGSPIYIDSWDSVRGVQRLSWVSPELIDGVGTGQWTNLSRVPPDGTPVKSDRGSYRFADGALVPVPISNPWLPYLGGLPTQFGSGPWSHLSQTPRDGTFVVNRDGMVFRFAGGTPFYVDSWDAVGGPQRVAPIDELIIEWFRAPLDGTFVRTANGQVHRYAGGAAFPVTDWAPFGGAQPSVQVSASAIERAGTWPWANLPALPTTSTFLRGAGTDDVYVVIGGAPVWLDPQWRARLSWQNRVIDVSAEVLRGPDPRWATIRHTPVDGTQLRHGNTHYLVVGGRLQVIEVDKSPHYYPATYSYPVSDAFMAGLGTEPWSTILPPA